MNKHLQAIDVYKQINILTNDLIQMQLCVDQTFPSMKQEKNNHSQVTITNPIDSSIMKNMKYKIVYDIMKKQRCFNMCFIDQALILMQYEFSKTEIVKARLMYMPNPDLADFQSNEEIYMNDDLELYSDFVDKRVVAFPIRIDYDPVGSKEIVHPKSHLTLGQFKNCRIPINAPVTPYMFIDFIVRNFYNTYHHRFEKRLTKFEDCFQDTITPLEKSITYVQLPSYE